MSSPDAREWHGQFARCPPSAVRDVQRTELFDYACVRARAPAHGHAHARPCPHVDEGCYVPTGGGVLVCACVRACMRACVRVCARARVRAWVRACARGFLCVHVKFPEIS